MSPVGDANLTAMLLHDAATNLQTQPRGIATAAEAWFEDVFYLVSPDAAASVGEFDDHVTCNLCGSGFAAQRNGNLATRRGVTNGVRDEIENYLLERALVAHYPILALIGEPFQGNRGLLRKRLNKLNGVRNQGRQ